MHKLVQLHFVKPITPVTQVDNDGTFVSTKNIHAVTFEVGKSGTKSVALGYDTAFVTIDLVNEEGTESSYSYPTSQVARIKTENL